MLGRPREFRRGQTDRPDRISQSAGDGEHRRLPCDRDGTLEGRHPHPGVRVPPRLADPLRPAGTRTRRRKPRQGLGCHRRVFVRAPGLDRCPGVGPRTDRLGGSPGGLGGEQTGQPADRGQADERRPIRQRPLQLRPPRLVRPEGEDPAGLGPGPGRALLAQAPEKARPGHGIEQQPQYAGTGPAHVGVRIVETLPEEGERRWRAVPCEAAQGRRPCRRTRIIHQTPDRGDFAAPGRSRGQPHQDQRQSQEERGGVRERGRK